MSIPAANGAAQSAMLMNSVNAEMDAVAGDVEMGQGGNDKLPYLKGGSEGETDKGMCSGRSLRTRVVHAIAILAMVMWGVAIGIELSIITYVAGACTAVVAPIVIMLQMRLQDTDSMRNVQNALRDDVNNLQEENNKLSAEVTLLEGKVGELRDQESRLEEITSEQGTNVHEFVGLVKENRMLLEKQKMVVRHDAAQLLSSVVINSDGNCDGNLNDQELRRLAAKLRSIPGVKVNEKKFHESVSQSGGKMGAILELVNQVTIREEEEDNSDDDNDDDGRVFTVIRKHSSDDESDGNRKEEKKRDHK